MKKWRIAAWCAVLTGAVLTGIGLAGNGAVVSAAGTALIAAAPQESTDTIKNGIFAEHIDLSGMTESEAGAAIADYVDSLRGVQITLVGAGGKEVQTAAGNIGIAWANPDMVQEALHIGTTGNVIERYKTIKDLQHENKVYDIELGFDVTAINDLLVNMAADQDTAPVNATLKRTDGAFQIVDGALGYQIDVETSIDIVYDYMTTQWNGESARIELDVQTLNPKGDSSQLARVKDILGSFTTSFTSSGADRSANVENGCRLIDGITLYPGEEFSTYATVAPFSVENGYYMAGSYLNGKVVDSLGGGICQVSTTLYNAVLLAELDVTERHNHSMIVTYVDPSADAAIAESAGKDFRFVNNTEAPIYIEGFIKNKKITFNIYGEENRQAGRKVQYVSEILETTVPPADLIYEDPSQPIGYFLKGDSAHIGYKARLWKVVTQDGAEVSREQVNKSTYKMAPRSATVGIATDNPQALEEIKAAIGTGSIDHVKNVIALLTAQPVQ